MELILLVVLLMLSAVFSGSETAFFALGEADRARLRTLGAAGRGAATLSERPNKLLAALLVGNLVANTAIGAVSTSLCLDWFGARGLAVAVFAATLLLLLVGEITPKILALASARQFVLLIQAPLRAWVAVTGPIVGVVIRSLDHILHRLPATRTGSQPLSTAELQIACDLAIEDGVLTQTEGRSLARLLQLRDLEVLEVMTPRPDVITLERDWDRGRILAAVRRAGFNRYPVVDTGSGQPVGLFHVKDLLARRTVERPLLESLRPLPVVPESKDAASLVAEMRTGHSHLAAVVDEHGDFAGIVTLADCLQALIGRVGDVSSQQPAVVTLGERRWVVRGGLDLRAVNEACGVELPASRDYVTVAGFVMARLGRIPQPGDEVSHGSAVLSVLAMQGHRVGSLEITRHDEPDGEAD